MSTNFLSTYRTLRRRSTPNFFFLKCCFGLSGGGRWRSPPQESPNSFFEMTSMPCPQFTRTITNFFRIFSSKFFRNFFVQFFSEFFRRNFFSDVRFSSIFFYKNALRLKSANIFGNTDCVGGTVTRARDSNNRVCVRLSGHVRFRQGSGIRD